MFSPHFIERSIARLVYSLSLYDCILAVLTNKNKLVFLREFVYSHAPEKLKTQRITLMPSLEKSGKPMAASAPSRSKYSGSTIQTFNGWMKTKQKLKASCLTARMHGTKTTTAESWLQTSLMKYWKQPLTSSFRAQKPLLIIAIGRGFLLLTSGAEHQRRSRNYLVQTDESLPQLPRSHLRASSDPVPQVFPSSVRP